MYPSQPYLGRMGVCQGLYERKIKHIEFTQQYVMIICLSWVHTKNWNEVFSCWVHKKKSVFVLYESWQHCMMERGGWRWWKMDWLYIEGKKTQNFMLWMLKPMMQTQQQYLIGYAKFNWLTIVMVTH